jgi:uncharacterized membrane protein YhhN
MQSFLFKSRNPVREMLGQIVLVISVFVAILYPFGILPFNPILVKGSAVGLLAIYALLRVSSFDHLLLVIALLAGAVGDMQLEIQLPDAFVSGLKNFLVGHIFYIIIFWRNRLDAFEVSRSRMNVASLLWVAAAVGTIWLWPSIVDGKFHLAAYAIGILGMATAALISRYPLKLVGTGAILFIASDALIGADLLFLIQDWVMYLVWPTYYLAQILITAGILLTPVKKIPHSLY